MGRGWSRSLGRAAVYVEVSELSSSKCEYMFSTWEKKTGLIAICEQGCFVLFPNIRNPRRSGHSPGVLLGQHCWVTRIEGTAGFYSEATNIIPSIKLTLDRPGNTALDTVGGHAWCTSWDQGSIGRIPRVFYGGVTDSAQSFEEVDTWVDSLVSSLGVCCPEHRNRVNACPFSCS